METEVLVLDADNTQNETLCQILRGLEFTPVPIASLEQFDRHASRYGCRAVIANIDSIGIDNRILKNMKRMYPEIHIIALSSRSFHPELEEAFRHCIYACIGVPADPHDLGYLLGSIFE